MKFINVITMLSLSLFTYSGPAWAQTKGEYIPITDMSADFRPSSNPPAWLDRNLYESFTISGSFSLASAYSAKKGWPHGSPSFFVKIGNAHSYAYVPSTDVTLTTHPGSAIVDYNLLAICPISQAPLRTIFRLVGGSVVVLLPGMNGPATEVSGIAKSVLYDPYTAPVRFMEAFAGPTPRTRPGVQVPITEIPELWANTGDVQPNDHVDFTIQKPEPWAFGQPRFYSKSGYANPNLWHEWNANISSPTSALINADLIDTKDGKPATGEHLLIITLDGIGLNTRERETSLVFRNAPQADSSTPIQVRPRWTAPFFGSIF